MDISEGSDEVTPLTDAAQILVMLSLLPEERQREALEDCKDVLRKLAQDTSGRIEVVTKLVAGLHRQIFSTFSMDGGPLIREARPCCVNGC